jgi:hypothetical protein
MNVLTQMAQSLSLKESELALNLRPDLRIPKRELPTELCFTFAPQVLRWCCFYLSYYSPRRQGEESLPEHLNSGQSFFPVRDRDSLEFFIIHVDQILYVREAVVMELKPGRPFQLLLDQGPVLRVSQLEPRRAWQARPIDQLNDAERFITFVQDDHARLHVNKDHIARVGGL